MSIDADTRAEVLSALFEYAKNYSKKDPVKIMASSDPDYFGFGSGPDEVVNNASDLRQHLERDFSQCGSLSMDFGSPHVGAEGNVAWCAGDCTISAQIGSEKFNIAGRMTAVLKKVGERWLFVHTHFSVPDRGQESGESFPHKK